MDRYVVIGNPVSHSLSPAIHAAFAKAEGDAIDYRAMLVPLGEFASGARRFLQGFFSNTYTTCRLPVHQPVDGGVVCSPNWAARR